jgi:hypothetical protein
MDCDCRLTLPFPAPTRQEQDALKLVGTYLVRAGSAATRRLLAERPGDDAELLATVSDHLLAGALLCAELTKLPPSDPRL